jgi:hypothetical protein
MGRGEEFAKAVVGHCLPGKSSGIEHVATSRPEEISDLALSDDAEITVEQLLKIGQGPSHDAKRSFEANLKERAEQTQPHFVNLITSADQSADPSFDGGFDALVRWRRTICPTLDPIVADAIVDPEETTGPIEMIDLDADPIDVVNPVARSIFDPIFDPVFDPMTEDDPEDKHDNCTPSARSSRSGYGGRCIWPLC